MLDSIVCQRATKAEINNYLAAAWACDRPVIVKFETSWCGPCRTLTEFLDAQQRSRKQKNEHFTVVRIDCEASEENQAYAAACGVSGYPTTQYYANGVLVETLRGFDNAASRAIDRVIGLVEEQRKKDSEGIHHSRPPTMSDELADAMERHQQTMTNDEFLEASKLLATFLRNVAMFPHEEKYRKVNTKNARFEKHASFLKDGLALVGFVQDGGHLVLQGGDVTKDVIKTAKLLQQSMMFAFVKGQPRVGSTPCGSGGGPGRPPAAGNISADMLRGALSGLGM